jgi:uncharacterized peroxidase-related enzyme
MAFIQTISPEEAQGAVRAMYARQQAAYGFIPNYAKVFCYRPEVMERWARLLAAIRQTVQPRRFELVTFAAAHALRNSYCSLAHGRALMAFFGEDDICALAKQQERESISPAEQQMMRFARKVATDASSITRDDITDLRRHGFEDDEIFDIAAVAAARSFFTKVLDSTGAEADIGHQGMGSMLRDTLTVGNPVTQRASEMLPQQEQAAA